MQFDTLPKNKKLFIFDLDGTVTDTEPCHFEAYRRTVEAFCPGQCVTEEEFLRCYVGHPETEIYALLKEKKHTDFDDAAFFRHRIDELFNVVAERGMKTAPFYRQLEAFFPNARFIALTSQRESVLDRFRETVDYGKITEFISVADKPYNKIDVLADTEKYLGAPQDDCIIFEDFAPTLHAAMKNGVYAVGIRHSFNALKSGDCDMLIDIASPLDIEPSRLDGLCDGEITLRLDSAAPADPAKNHVPSYKFTVCAQNGAHGASAGTELGRCALRAGHNENTYYGGNIGYEIFENFRGHRYAAKASRLLFTAAKMLGMNHVYITCRPDNLPSRRTCEILGGEYIETAKLPEYNDMYKSGMREVAVFRYGI